MGFLLVLLSATGFATLAVFGKFAFAAGMSLTSVLAWRFIVSASALLPILLIRGSWRIRPQLFLTAFLLGAVGYAVQATLFFTALQRTSAAITSLLLYTYPAFVAVIGRLVFKEKLSNWRLAALVLSMLGVVLTIPFDGSRIELTGALIALSSGVWYACYLSFGARRVHSVDPIATTGILSLGAAISFSIAAVTFGGLETPAQLGVWNNLIAIGLVATVLPVVTLFAALKRLGVTKTSIMSTLEPVLTAILGFIWLGESLNSIQIAGGTLVLVSAVLLQIFG